MFDEEKLISLVTEYKSLYDKTNKFYDDSVVRENCWKSISAAMNEPDSLCRKKWRNLREAYRKALKVRECRSIDTISKPCKPWKYESQMGFLRQFMGGQKMKLSNNTVIIKDNDCVTDIEDDNTYQQDITMQEQPGSKSSSPIPFSGMWVENQSRKRKSENCETVTEVLGKFLDSKTEENDAIVKFFESMADTVKDLPLPLQIKVKQQVLEIVCQAELMAASGDTIMPTFRYHSPM